MALTGATSVIMFTIPGVFPTPVQLQGFAADDVFDVDQVTIAETLMGVDGVLSGGFIYMEVKQTFALQADSASNAIFDQWRAAQIAGAITIQATATIALPDLQTKWSCAPGFLTIGNPIPAVKKLIQPRKFQVIWGQVSPSPSN